MLLLATLALLFVPKLLAMFLTIPKARQFGGVIPLVASTLIETVIWTLFAPAIMLYYTQFVVMNLAGLQIPWSAQNRSDTGIPILRKPQNFLARAANGFYRYDPFFLMRARGPVAAEPDPGWMVSRTSSCVGDQSAEAGRVGSPSPVVSRSGGEA